MRGLAKLDWDFLLLFFLVLQQCKIQDPSFLDCMTSSKLYRNRKQNFQVLKPNVNCVTLAAGCSTPQVYNVNWVVPPAGYIPQKWGGHVPPSSYGGAAHAYMPPIGHMDWIGFGSAFTSSLWIALDWVIELMDWSGLDLENWTHVQLWRDCGIFSHYFVVNLLLIVFH